MKVKFLGGKFIFQPEWKEEKDRLRLYQPDNRQYKTVSNSPDGQRLMRILLEDIPTMEVEEDLFLQDPVLVPLPTVSGMKPMPHQIQPIRAMLTFNHHALWVEMGLGKTFDSLYCIRVWAAQKPDFRGVVVVPKRVIPTWIKQFKQFAPDIKVFVMGDEYSVEQRANFFKLAAVLPQTVILTNYETFRMDSPTIKVLEDLKVVWDCIFLDESVKIRYTDTKNFRGLYQIQDYFKRRYVLSGLPAPQSPADYVGQLAFLHPVYVGYQARGTFEKDFVQRDTWSGRINGWKHLDWIHKRVQSVATVQRKDDVDLGLPPKSYVKKYVEMGTEQKRIYTELAKKFLSYVKGLKDSGDLEISAPNVLSKMVRLSQLTGGWLCGAKDKSAIEDDLFFNEEDMEIPTLPPIPFDYNPKMDMLEEIIEDNLQGKTFVVVARYLHEIKAISEKLYSMGLTCEKITGSVTTEKQVRIEQDFFDGKLACVIIQSESGKYGLNLQTASTLIYFSNSYSYDSRGQSEDRVHRIGQKNNVTIIDIVADASIDEEIIDTLIQKKSVSDLILKNPELVLKEEYAALY